MQRGRCSLEVLLTADSEEVNIISQVQTSSLFQIVLYCAQESSALKHIQPRVLWLCPALAASHSHADIKAPLSYPLRAPAPSGDFSQPFVLNREQRGSTA